MAQKLNFSKNKGIKEYCFADDENAIIRINTRDSNLYPRLNESRKKLEALYKEYENFNADSEEESAKALVNFDNRIKAELDYMFDYPVSEVAFGNFSSISIYDGMPAFQSFLNAILPEIYKDIDSEHKESEKVIDKFVNEAEQYE